MKPSANKTRTYVTPDPLQDEQLLHYLFSPLEIKALEGSHDAVLKPTPGRCIALPPRLNEELARIGQRKVRLLAEFSSGLPREHIHHNPALEHFLHRPLADHGLPTRLYHLLQGKDCHTMEDVIGLSLRGIRSMRGIGKGSIRALQKLLETNGCEGLL